jgi:hypothetical protein
MTGVIILEIAGAKRGQEKIRYKGRRNETGSRQPGTTAFKLWQDLPLCLSPMDGFSHTSRTGLPREAEVFLPAFFSFWKVEVNVISPTPVEIAFCKGWFL